MDEMAATKKTVLSVDEKALKEEAQEKKRGENKRYFHE